MKCSRLHNAPRSILLTVMLISGSLTPVFAQDPTDIEPLPLFADEAPLYMELTADLETLLEDNGDDRSYHNAVVTYLDENDKPMALNIRAEVRGNFRRMYLDCDVPPLKLNFKDAKKKNTVFKKQKTLKLVTHCRNKNDAYQQYLFQEYLIYKSYALLTDYSFQVRMVEITYRDIKRKKDDVTRYGFLIEEDEALAERLGGRLLESGAIQQQEAEPTSMNLTAVFQYMIGNTDWAVPKYHNIKVVYYDSTQTVIPVPYDFDWSGIINTPYAEPREHLGIRSVRQRLYRGICHDEDVFQKSFDRFNEQKENLLSLWKKSDFLEKKYREDSVEYLEEFYEDIQDRDDVMKDFQRACRYAENG